MLNTETLSVARTIDYRFDEYIFPKIISQKIKQLKEQAKTSKSEAKELRRDRKSMRR